MTKIDVNDLVGSRFGRLLVVSYDGHYARENSKIDKRFHHYNCKCDCGNISIVERSNIRGGRTNSCGCLHNEELSKKMTTHGLSKSKIYMTYSGMIKRCYNKNNLDYKHYGGRGIEVCDEWLSDDGFFKFYEWAVNNGYNKGLTIDRIDVNSNYSPENCRWADMKTQVINRRKTRIPIAISPDGVVYEISCLEDFIKDNDMDRFTVYKCLRGEYKQHKKWKFYYKEIKEE